jgi:hypothetical protein
MSKQYSSSWGGARNGAGRLKQNIHLDRETARALAILTGQRRSLSPNITEDQVVASLIEQAWHELDEIYQEHAEKEG